MRENRKRWEDMWKQRNNRPHDVWATQGVGIGLPVVVPMADDPREDRFLMDQLVDTGSRTVEGLAAMNGEVFRRLGDDHPGKGLRAPFEAAYQNLKKVMGLLRSKPKADFNHEKSMDKLKDEFSAFKDLKGNPHDEEDDGVDFDPDEEVPPDNSAKPEAQIDEPEYEDMVDGPLPERGLNAGPKYLGPPRFPWAVVWAPPAPLQIGLEGKKGFSNQYVDPKGQFTTVTRVVSATADGKPKVLLSYMLEALSVKEARMNQPWKSSEAREKMFLMKLRVMGDASGDSSVWMGHCAENVDSTRPGQGLLLPTTVCASERVVFSARVLRDLGQEGARVQRGTSSDQGGPATVEHRHPLRNDNEGSW